MISCCNKNMKALDYKHGQYKCECENCGKVIYYEPYDGE